MKRISIVLACLLSGTVAADQLKAFDFEIPPQSAQAKAGPVSCAFEDLELPADLLVYAAGAYAGRALDFQIDQSGHTATRFDVAVNSPSRPVALILGAYEPTVWNLGWTQGTEIVAVLVSGYHRQAIAGLASTVPVFNSSYHNRGPCGYVYIGKGRNTALNPLSRKLFGAPVDLVYPGDKSGAIVIGEPLEQGTALVTSAEVSPSSFRDADAPLAGQPGIDSAITKGVLRPATTADVNAWGDAVVANSPALDVPPVAGEGIPRPAAPGLHKAYVVLKQFTYPAGLFGAHSAVFLVPQGVPLPEGDPGHSAVYDFNALQCRGARC